MSRWTLPWINGCWSKDSNSKREIIIIRRKIGRDIEKKIKSVFCLDNGRMLFIGIETILSAILFLIMSVVRYRGRFW